MGEPAPASAATGGAEVFGPSEQGAHADARQQDPGEGPGPVDARRRPGDLGHEPSQAGRPGESAEPAHQQGRGRATTMTGWLAVTMHRMGFLDGHGVLLRQVRYAPW
jgi:hypothetical protein